MTTTVRSVMLVWKIENFSCCLFETEVPLWSPLFNGPALDGIKWYLYLYPRGKNVNDNIDVGIVTGTENNSVEECEFLLLASDGSTLVSKNGSKIHKSKWAAVGFVRRGEIFGSKRNYFLPDDTLTLRCRLLEKSTERLQQPETLFAHTRFESEQDFFTWSIEDFFTLQTPKMKELKTPKGNVLNYKIYKSVRFDSDDKVQMDITLSRSFYGDSVQSIFNVSVLDNSGNWVKFAEEAEGILEMYGGDVMFTSTFTYENLNRDKDIYLGDGVLKLKCEYFLGGIVQREEIENDPSINTKTPGPSQRDKQCMTEAENLENESRGFIADTTNSIGSDFQCLYEEGILSDFSLRAGTKTFRVHKNILSARSPVFKAMFTVDMKERASESMDIPDVAEDTLQKMLLFVYSDKVEENMPWENATKLYFVADKYAIEPLKRRCSTILKANTCATNVFDILVLADMYQDQDLKSSLQDFILSHNKDVVGTEEWNTFQNKYLQLAVEILSKLYMKIRN